MNANAANFAPGGQQQQGYVNPYAADRQQMFSSENLYAMYDASFAAGYPTNAAMYYDHQNANPYTGGNVLDPSAAAYGDWNQGGFARQEQPQDPDTLASSTEPGSYYPVAPLLPQWGTAPVTAVAYDEQYSAMYVASATQSNGRPNAPSRYNSQPDQPNYDRSAMLSMHSTNPMENGTLYASVAGHPEASRNALIGVYASMYGFSGTTTKGDRVTAPHAPSHAYKPVYGRTNASTPGMDLATAMVGGAFSVGKNTFHMGINSLLPMSGHVASISPGAVRIHAHGGLQLADQPLEGMICGTAHPGTQDQGMVSSHITVGGVASGKHHRHQLHCLDVWQGLQVAASRTFRDSDHNSALPLGVTALATSHERGSIVVGCSDGKIRFLDGSLREIAKIRGHGGSVNDIAVSDDGMLIATTGYGHGPSGNTSLYAFPDPNILVFDIRYLGRGGIAHPFSGLNGGPRFLSFIPSVSDDQPSNRLVVASGQTGGGMQVIVPFEPSQNEYPSSFMLPQLDRGEAISAMVVSEENLALGTSQCRVLQYKMAGYTGSSPKTVTSTSAKEFIPSSSRSHLTGGSPNKSFNAMNSPSGARQSKQPLEIPPFVPPLPALSLEPSLLQTDNPNVRNGMNDRIKSIFTSYTLIGEPTVSALSLPPHSTFGPLGDNVVMNSSRRNISTDLMAKADATEGDYLMTIPTKNLEIDLMANLDRKPNKPSNRTIPNDQTLPNPNKTIYSKQLSAVCYKEGVARTNGSKDAAEAYQDESNQDIPPRYRLTLRPTYKSSATFDHAEYNNTAILPGWDYPPTMPNAFASPLLLLLYFNPTLRESVFSAQFNERLLVSRSPSEKNLLPELGFLFHQMESLSRLAFSYPTNLPYRGPKLKAWVPTHFQASLASMPEAVQLQILDGSPAAVDLPRRAEAFYLFLLYQLDKEFSKISEPKILDSMHGTDFLSVNEFITGSGETSQSSARALTIELSYEGMREDPSSVRFGHLLQRALCGETRLRAWNQKSRSYETIVQRKIATSLPRILSLSCACAGRKEEDGLKFWRSTLSTEDHWLPEILEVELEDNGGVSVKQHRPGGGKDEWDTFGGSSSIPSSVAALVLEQRASAAAKKKYWYQLDAVVSFVRDDMDSNLSDSLAESSGHHVVHVRAPKTYKKLLLSEQYKELKSLASTTWTDTKMFVRDNNWDQSVFQQRAEKVKSSLDALEGSGNNDSWFLANGYVVSDTVIEDARAFHVPFKEPCLVVYRAMDEEESESTLPPSDKLTSSIPADVLKTKSITDGSPPKYSVEIESLPGEGDLIAFDAEFVSVQEEESTLTKKGSKVTLREVRHAVARISVIDCRTRKVLIDDHVLPKEPVVDYLTRFSGIVAKDLDPNQSLHHLVSTRSAYLKLRFLMERGCIFVGHGLSQDFLMVNLVVPNNQIIDTVEIFHQERMRYISLRFLTNYILERDMQQDTHDSLEDALAAYELYLKACELKKAGTFGKVLNDLYEFGRKTDWKLGVDAK